MSNRTQFVFESGHMLYANICINGYLDWLYGYGGFDGSIAGALDLKEERGALVGNITPQNSGGGRIQL